MDLLEYMIPLEVFQMLTGPLPPRGKTGPHVQNPKSSTKDPTIKSFATKLEEELLKGKPSEIVHIYKC